MTYADTLKVLDEPYYVRSGPRRKNVGAVTGYHVHVEGRFTEMTIQQHLFLIETESFYVSLTASYIDEADLALMKKAISTLRVHAKSLRE